MKEALEGLLDTEHRTVQKHFNVTPYEDTFIRSAAKKAGMTQSRFMVDRILHTPMYYIGDPDFFQKFFYELNKQGVNLNQLTAAANTLVLLQDMPDVSKEHRRELIGQIENFVATLKDPLLQGARGDARPHDAAQAAVGSGALAWRCSRRSPASSADASR